MINAESSVSAPKSPVAASRGLLDPQKRALLLQLLSRGWSRRAAGRFVGCHAATIARTAERDADFRQRLVTAEELLGITALEQVQTAAAEPRYWRAAAWILERRRPDEFGRRDARSSTPDQLDAVLDVVMDAVAASGVSDEQLIDIENRLQKIVDAGRAEAGDDQDLDPELAASDPCPSDPPPTSAADAPATADPAARNTQPTSSNNPPRPQVTVQQQVAASVLEALRATPAAGVAQTHSRKRKDQRKNYGLPFGRPTNAAQQPARK